MPKRSAGFLLYRRGSGDVEVLIGHMGGPLWARKDEGGWSIPKGEYDAGDDALAVARREFEEELGSPPPDGPVVDLGEARQPSGKIVTVWAGEGDLDASACRSNTFRLEWPRGSGRLQEFPEIDRAAWFGLGEARRKLLRGQHVFLDRLASVLGAGS